MSPKTQSSLCFWLILAFGVSLRLFLLSKGQLRQWLENRVEISTPLTSWSRVLEGVYLKTTQGAPNSYQGDLVHEMPSMLKFYEVLVELFQKENIKFVFVLIDALNGIVLYLIAAKAIDYLNAVEALNKRLGKYNQSKLKDKLEIINRSYLKKFRKNEILRNLRPCYASSYVLHPNRDGPSKHFV